MKTPIIILHGWGLFGEKYKELRNIFGENGYKVFLLDLPGFGGEKLIKESMFLDDYVEFVEKFIDKNKLKKIILIGHSFGGRVSVKFAVKYPNQVEKLVLTGAPVIREKLNFKKNVISYLVKKLKILVPKPIEGQIKKIIYKFLGEWDYYKAKNLKQTFVNIINEDLTQNLKDIKTPTFLIWGENDKFVPIEYAGKANKLIEKSKLKIISNESHGLPYNNPELFAKEILEHIN